MAFDLVMKFEVEDHYSSAIKNIERQMRRIHRTVEDTANAFRDVERAAERVESEIRRVNNFASMFTTELQQTNIVASSVANQINDITQEASRTAHEMQQVTNEIQQATAAAVVFNNTMNSTHSPNVNTGNVGSTFTSLQGSVASLVSKIGLITVGGSAAIASLAPLVKVTGNLGASMISAGVGTVGYAAVAVPALTKVFTSVEDIAKAEEKLANADTYKQRIKAQKELNSLYDGMSKSQAKAVKGLQTYKGFYSDFAAEFEQPVFNAFAEGLTFVEKLMKSLKPSISGVSTVVVDMMQKLNKAIEAPAAVSFFDWIAESAGPSLSNLGKIAGNVIGGTMSLFQAFGTSTKDVEDGLIGVTQRFQDWAEGLSESQGFKDFVNYTEENGPVLLDTFKNIAGSVENTVKAFAPLGTDTLATIQDFTASIEWLSEKMNKAGDAAQWVSENVVDLGTASKVWMGPVGLLMLAVEDLTSDTSSLKSAWENTWDSIVSKTADGVSDVIKRINALINKINDIPFVDIPNVSTPKWVSNNAPVPMGGAPKQTSRQQPFKTPTAFRNLPIQFSGSPSIPGHATGLESIPYDDYLMRAHKQEALLTAPQANLLRSLGVLKSAGEKPVLDTTPLKRGTSTHSAGSAAGTAIKSVGVTAKSAENTYHIQFGDINIIGAQKTTKEIARDLMENLKHAISNGALA